MQNSTALFALTTFTPVNTGHHLATEPADDEKIHIRLFKKKKIPLTKIAELSNAPLRVSERTGKAE